MDEAGNGAVLALNGIDGGGERVRIRQVELDIVGGSAGSGKRG